MLPLQRVVRALGHLEAMGLTAAVVVANFHRRRVLPLMSRHLCMNEMTDGTPLEGVEMAPNDLEHDDVAKRVKKVEGTKEQELLLICKVPMRPDLRYPRLVSCCPLF